MIKYVVEINYYNFTFNDAAEAVKFALSAKTHSAKGPDDLTVGIVLEADEADEDDLDDQYITGQCFNPD